MGHPVLIKLSLQIRAGVPLRPRGRLRADDVPVGARGAIPLPRLPTRKLPAAPGAQFDCLMKLFHQIIEQS